MTEFDREEKKIFREPRILSGMDRVLISKACNVRQKDLCYVMAKNKLYGKRLTCYFSLSEYRKIAYISHKSHCFSS